MRWLTGRPNCCWSLSMSANIYDCVGKQAVLRVNVRPYLPRLPSCLSFQLALLRLETIQQLPTALRTVVLGELEHLGLANIRTSASGDEDGACAYNVALSRQDVVRADLDVYAAHFRGECGNSGLTR